MGRLTFNVSPWQWARYYAFSRRTLGHCRGPGSSALVPVAALSVDGVGVRARRGCAPAVSPEHIHGPLVPLQPWSAPMVTDAVLQVPCPHWRPSPLYSLAPSIPGCLLQLSPCRHWVLQVSPRHWCPPTCSAHVCTCPLATACLCHRGLLPEWPVTVDQQTSPPSGCTSAPSMEV